MTKIRYDRGVIHTFSVSNYHSVREEVVLDLRIPSTSPDLPRFRRSAVRSDVRLPTVAVLMGPNGAGKTTLLRALTVMAHCASTVAASADKAVIGALVPFWSTENRAEPIRFRLDFEGDWLMPGKSPQLFRYEAEVGPAAPDSRETVYRHEGLFHFPKARARRLFERGGPGEPIRLAREVAVELGLGANGRLKAIRNDASVLATLAVLGVPLAKRISAWIQGILAWSNISWFEPQEFSTRKVIDMIDKNYPVKPWIEERIQASDLGIHGLEIHDVDDPGNSEGKIVFFKHRGLDFPVPMYFESSGTKRLFHLLPRVRRALDAGAPLVLDEIDGDLHVDVAGEIMDWFRSGETNPRNAQLLVTSHNVGLLDDLEKEEVFIVEKTRDGATRVHGAQDVRGLRRDARLYPKYRAGVLGGVPKIG